ncbi:MAG: DUF4038 domain-containing protein [Omnitrophica WOR_2 bacterium]
MSLYAIQYEAQEWGYTSGKGYADPFNDLELDVLLTHESGPTYRVPTYWAGGQEWRVRFAPPLPGSYQVITECTDKDSDLHGKTTNLLVSPYTGKDPLLSHGALKVAASRRTLEYSDGTPFFWLGDTWWMGLCKRLPWPDGFQQLAADRAAKGFTVIQIVAGLYPDMPGFDPRGENEAGFPWEPGYARINPSYFDMADLRIRWMVKSGLTPCIVSGWGYYLPILGIEKIKKHWRNLVARWGAYPVIWCLAGEVLMPYYLSEDKEGDAKIQREGWIEVARYLRQIDPYHHLVTVHDQMLDSQLIDINMMQTGHDGYFSVPNTVKMVKEARLREPVMPGLVGEANYEGIMHTSEAEAQRLTFWSSMLSGAMGHTYGANGIWQVNNLDKPYGPSPWGGTWGGLPWNEAMRLPGGTQIALGKKLLERYEWWRFEPHQDWVDPCGSPENVDLPFAAGIPGQVRIIYFYKPTVQLPNPQHHVTHLEHGVTYRAFFWDPRSGREYDLAEVAGDADGAWAIPIQPELKDWVVVLERKTS